MISMYYERVVIVGTGAFAYSCANHIKKLGIPVTAIEYDIGMTSSFEILCNRDQIEFHRFKKSELTEYLIAIEDRCLCISALSVYIFPACVINKPNLYIINYHNSLLPKYAGRNAEAWAIFNMEKETGITWHKINEIIDGGDIIYQKQIPIKDDYTSKKLFGIQNSVALKVFHQIIDSILKREIDAIQKNDVSSKHYHTIREIPNGAFLDINWPLEKIHAFLRAMDYGILFSLGKPKLIFHNQTYQWETYKFNNPALEIFQDRIIFSRRDIKICDGEKNICLKNYYEVL